MRAVIFLFLWLTGAQAQSRVQLISGMQPFAGVVITLDKGYKTYFRTPGESGLAPQFDFSASQNLKTIDVLWPFPKAFGEGVASFWGYETRVILPLKYEAVDPQKPVTLTLSLDYGACKEICLPQKAKQSLILSAIPHEGLAKTLAELPKEETPLVLLSESALMKKFKRPAQVTDVYVEDEKAQSFTTLLLERDDFTLPKSLNPLTLYLKRGENAPITTLKLTP